MKRCDQAIALTNVSRLVPRRRERRGEPYLHPAGSKRSRPVNSRRLGSQMGERGVLLSSSGEAIRRTLITLTLINPAYLVSIAEAATPLPGPCQYIYHRSSRHQTSHYYTFVLFTHVKATLQLNQPIRSCLV